MPDLKVKLDLARGMFSQGGGGVAAPRTMRRTSAVATADSVAGRVSVLFADNPAGEPVTLECLTAVKQGQDVTVLVENGKALVLGPAGWGDAITGDIDEIRDEMTQIETAVFYGTCQTAGATAAKTVQIDGFSLKEGATVIVTFDHGNTASGVTLDVSGTGAEPIVNLGEQVGSGAWSDGEVVYLAYDGTSWQIIGNSVYAREVTVGLPGAEHIGIGAGGISFAVNLTTLLEILAHTGWSELNSPGGPLRFTAGTNASPSGVFFNAPNVSSGVASDIGAGLVPSGSGSSASWRFYVSAPLDVSSTGSFDGTVTAGKPALADDSAKLATTSWVLDRLGALMKVYGKTDRSLSADTGSTPWQFLSWTSSYRSSLSLGAASTFMALQSNGAIKILVAGYYRLSCGFRPESSNGAIIGMSLEVNSSNSAPAASPYARAAQSIEGYWTSPTFIVNTGQVYYVPANYYVIPVFRCNAAMTVRCSASEQYTFWQVERVG